MPCIVVIGGGHAAAHLCSELVAQASQASKDRPDSDWRLTVVSEEAHPPYHRPPLSKNFLREPAAGLQPLLGEAFYREHEISLRLRTRAERIDRARQQIVVRSLDAGAASEYLPYDVLVLATGARARRLPLAWDQGLPVRGVHLLRSAEDALELAGALRQARSLAVLGAGFIGLEVAATAAALGLQVIVVESAARVLARAVSPALSEHLLEVHTRSSIDFRLCAQVRGLQQRDGRFSGLTLTEGHVSADLLLVGVGAEPETALALECGLDCENGVAVDEGLATNDPRIFAIGDCASFPSPVGGGRMRLESVQNTQAQARLLGQRLLGHCGATVYEPTPSFWSDQGQTRLQIAGLWQPDSESVRRAGTRSGSFSLLHYVGERLLAVESVNAPAEHMMARRWLARGYSPSKDRAADGLLALGVL